MLEQGRPDADRSLDKLHGKGLLEAHYARPAGRAGPGAGRTSKFYEPVDEEIAVSLPQRGYDFVGDLLVDAIERQREGETPRDSARRVASEAGMALGRQVEHRCACALWARNEP